MDLSVDLFADPQQRFPISFLRHSQMIGKIVAQAADAPVEHGNVLIVVQEHGALQALESLQLRSKICEPDQQNDDHQQDSQKSVGKVLYIAVDKLGRCTVIEGVFVAAEEHDLPEHVNPEGKQEIQQTDLVRDLFKEPAQLLAECVIDSHDREKSRKPGCQQDHAACRVS